MYIHENLTEFLSIRPDFSRFLLEKKVRKVIKIFSQTKGFREIGTKRKKFDMMAKYYEQRKKMLD